MDPEPEPRSPASMHAQSEGMSRAEAIAAARGAASDMVAEGIAN